MLGQPVSSRSWASAGSLFASALTLACFLRHIGACAWHLRKWRCRRHGRQNTAPDSLSLAELAGKQVEPAAVGPGAEGRHGLGEPANHAWSLGSPWEAPLLGTKRNSSPPCTLLSSAVKGCSAHTVVHRYSVMP